MDVVKLKIGSFYKQLHIGLDSEIEYFYVANDRLIGIKRGEGSLNVIIYVGCRTIDNNDTWHDSFVVKNDLVTCYNFFGTCAEITHNEFEKHLFSFLNKAKLLDMIDPKTIFDMSKMKVINLADLYEDS